MSDYDKLELTRLFSHNRLGDLIHTLADLCNKRALSAMEEPVLDEGRFVAQEWRSTARVLRLVGVPEG